MRFDNKTNTLFLSERNLLSLLTKLHTEGSQCTIEGGDDCMLDDYPMRVKAEPDDVHYGGREYGPGLMHPVTEQLVKALRDIEGARL
jgi:hypothetical protein